MDSNITLQTKQMIDSLKAVCTNFGLGNASSEYKIITEVFLYKFLNDKFLFEAKRVEPALAKLSPADAEKQLAQMTDDDYELFLLGFGPDTAKLKQTHFISYLFNRKNEENFHTVFDDTLLDIATYNIDIFSVRTGGQSKMRLFSGISQHVIEAEKKDDFCRAIIDKIAECSFDSVFEQKYDFFAQIFEYLIKDYNKDFGKYAEYYTPHSIASIIAKIMVPNGAKNVTVYTPNVEFSFDVAIIKKNPNGNYMRLVHNKPWNQYTWNEVPRSHQVKDRADDIKEEGLWQEVRDKYLEKKNMYLSWQDHNHPSFVVYVEAVNEVYNRYFNRGGGYSVQSIF